MRHAQPWKSNRARSPRDNATSAESKLWQRLRNRQLDHLKFVRHHPLELHFADFVCREEKVVIEIDGATHRTEPEVAADGMRTRKLELDGYRVFRVDHGDVLGNVDGVLTALLDFI